MPDRTIIRDLAQLHSLLPQWYGKTFAFDVETTGLDYVNDKLCGLALTFEDGKSYYVLFRHAVPEQETTTEQHEERVLLGYTTETYYTPKKHKEKTREVPVYETRVVQREVEKTTYPLREFVPLPQAVTMLRSLFIQGDVVMVAHNAKFDLHFLSRAGLQIGGKLADTMLAAKLINENRDVGLKELATLVDLDLKHYQELEHYPGFHKDDYHGVVIDLAVDYAMLDTEATLALWNRFKSELVLEGVDHAFRDVWMPMLITLQEMEAKGVALDLEKVAQVRAEYEREMDEHESAIWHEGVEMVLARYPDPRDIPNGYLRMATEDEIADAVESLEDASIFFVERGGGVPLPMFRPTPRSAPRIVDFNPGSNAQLGELIYDHLKLSLPDNIRSANTNGGKPVDKNTIKIMQLSMGEKAPPVLKHIQDRRQAEKFIGTYLDRFLADADPDDNNSMRTTFNQTVAATGRLTSTSPNLQNLPSRGKRGKECRDMVIARPGMKLIVADYSMMELRMAAHYAAKLDPNHSMMRAFRDGMDLHLLTASNQFGIPYDELACLVADGDTDAKLKRSIGKTSNFGLLYGMGARKFQIYLWTEVGIYLPLDEVARLIEQFNETYEAVTEWKGLVTSFVHRKGYVETIAGRKRRVPEIWSPDKYEVMRAERQAINAVIQGSCADIINEAIPAIQMALRPLGGYVLLQVHDEIVAEAPEELAQTAAKIVETYMTGLVNHKLRCPLGADAHIGDTWGSAKG